MSISSDVYISREEARDRVKSKLLAQQKELIEHAIRGMTDTDLT